MAKTVKARWVGSFEANLPDGTLLVPGETVVDISAGEADQSDNWEVQGSKKTAAKESDQ